MMQFDPGSFLSGLVGMVAGGGIVAVWVKALLGQVRELRRELVELRDGRIADIERRVEAFQADCIGPRVGESLRNLEGWTKTIDMKLDRIAEEAAAASARIAGDRKWLENLDAAYQRHAGNRETHAR